MNALFQNGCRALAGNTKSRTETRPAGNQSGVLPLSGAQCRLFRGFQRVNHKCGSVLPRFFIKPSALNISRPSGDLKSLDTVIEAPPDFSRTTSPTLNAIAPSPNTATKNYFATAVEAALRRKVAVARKKHQAGQHPSAPRSSNMSLRCLAILSAS